MQLEFKNLVDLLKAFPDEQSCIDFIAQWRWNGKPKCVHCGHDKVYKYQSGKIYKCAKCRQQFSVKVGTIFEDSPVKLQKWFMAIYLITAHKKGISSIQLGKDIGVTQKTAWFMNHRIRKAMGINETDEKLSGMVETDETYMGGKAINKKYKPLTVKVPVLGLVERNGNVRMKPVLNADKHSIAEFIKENVDVNKTVIISDEFSAYSNIKSFVTHNTVNHQQEYVNGDIHTNTIEGFWSQLKRGVYGIYHQVSPKHLHRYCGEFGFRYNTRFIEDKYRFTYTFTRLNGRLDYKTLIGRQ